MTTGIRLYEIAAEREILDSWLAESEGELTPEIEALLNELDEQADTKIERVALYIRERLAEAKAVREERDRLDATVRRLERAGDSLKNYLKSQMERMGKVKVNGLLATVAIQRNSQPSVTCALSEEQLRQAFVSQDGNAVGQFVREVPVSYRLDRESVLLAAKASYPIPPEIVVEAGTHVRIR